MFVSAGPRRAIMGRKTAVAVMVSVALAVLSWVTSVGAAPSITLMTPEAANQQAVSWYTDVLKPSFQKATGITLNVVVMPNDWGGYFQKLSVLFAAGQAPDVFTLGDVGTSVQQGMLMPLDRYTSGWDGLQDIPRPALQDCTVGGKLYAIPYRLDQRALYYRRDIFEEAGLDGNRPPVSWDDLVSMGQKLAVRNPDGSYVRDALNLWVCYPTLAIFIYQNGGRLISPDGTRAEFASPASKEAIQFFLDLSQRYHIGSPNGSAWKGTFGVVTGTTAMEYGGDWMIGEMSRVNPKQASDLQVTLPLKKVTRSGLLFVNKWAIARTTKQPDAAWKLVQYLASPEIAGDFARVNSQLPARVSVIRSQSPWKDDRRWLTIVAAAEGTIPFPNNAYKLGDALASLENAMRLVIAGKTSPEQALETAVSEADRLLQHKS